MVDSRAYSFFFTVHTSGLPYDIGYGQKLFLRCRGHGAPTGFVGNVIREREICVCSFVCSYSRCSNWNEFGYLASASRESED